MGAAKHVIMSWRFGAAQQRAQDQNTTAQLVPCDEADLILIYQEVPAC